jgi:beta-lactam-binding protein with PASTA domain
VSGEPPRRRRRPTATPRPPARRVDPSYALPTAIGVLALIVALVALAAYRMLVPSGSPVELPDFAHQQFDDAQRAAAAAHVSLRVIAHRPDDHAAKGEVVGQFPAAREHVREGRVVEVIVSDGPSTGEVPNLSNMSLRDAEVAIGNARFELGILTTERNTTVAAGRVLSQHPDAFANAPAGSKIDVTVAAGRPDSYVPNFVGLSLSFSQSAAKQAGIALALPIVLPIAKNAKPKDIVISQDPLPGQPLSPGQKIQLQVSGGPPATPTPIPTVEPIATDTPAPASSPTPVATESPAPASPTAVPAARSLRVAVQLPSSKTPKRVRVALVDATGSRDLYDQTTAGGFTLSFDVTVTGVGTIQTYVDGTLVTTTPL